MDSEIIEKSSALVKRSFTGILGTVDENGIPQLKAMIKTAADGIKEFWFCSKTQTLHQRESSRYRQIQLPASISMMKRPLKGLCLQEKQRFLMMM